MGLMVTIIVGLLVVLIVFVVVVTAIQQHKEKLDAERRVHVAKQKAIIDENEELILSLTNLPPNPHINKILNTRSLNAVKTIKTLTPEKKSLDSLIKELNARLQVIQGLIEKKEHVEKKFVLPDNEKQIIVILQCVKKLRAVLRSEQNKGVISAELFKKEDQHFELIQLKINVESLMNRAAQAQHKQMIGSARQYYEKALMTIAKSSSVNEYLVQKKAEIASQLESLASSLKNVNAQDAETKAKSEENELDVIFQQKKKW